MDQYKKNPPLPALDGINYDNTESVVNLQWNDKQEPCIINQYEPAASTKLVRAPAVLPRVTVKRVEEDITKIQWQGEQTPNITHSEGFLTPTLKRELKQHLCGDVEKHERNSPPSENAPTKSAVTQETQSEQTEISAKKDIGMSDIPNAEHKDPFTPAAKQKRPPIANSDKDKLCAYDLAELLLDRYIIRAFSAQERIGVYDQDFGYFKLMKRRQWPLFLLKALDGTPYKKALTKSSMDAIFTFLVHEPRIQASFDEFDRRKNLINVRNGVVSVKDLTLRPHSPKYMFTSYLNVDFNPKAKEPKHFLEMMNYMFDSEEERQLCLESLAYLISNDTTAKKLVFFFGVPSSGKTTLSQLLLLIHGSEFVSAVALGRFAGRFELGGIMHKRLNLCPEVESIKPTIARVIKALTGGDRQTLEDKFEDMFFGHLKLKLVLTANPPLPDVPMRLAQDNGFLSRLLFIYFKHTIPATKRCEDIATVLFEQEGEGILYLFLCTLRDWYAHGKEFTHCESSDELLDEFAKRCIQTERYFAKTFCVVAPEAFTSITTMYKEYVRDCTERGVQSDSYDYFKYAMSLILPTLKEDRKRVEKGGNPVAVFCGIRLIENEKSDAN